MSMAKIALAVLMLGITASAQAQPAPAKVDIAQPPKPAQTPKPADEPITLETSAKLRDPFRIPFAKGAAVAEAGGLIPEVERYSVEDFKLVGVITGTKRNKALVSTPDGKMHVLTERMRVGNKSGLVTKILPSSVSIQEKALNILGREETIEMRLEFKDKEKL